MVGRKPRIIFPGKTEESFVGRPQKYLKYSALVIPLDTSKVPTVARMRITGNNPETKDFFFVTVFLYLLKWGYQEAAAAMMTRICWWVR